MKSLLRLAVAGLLGLNSLPAAPVDFGREVLPILSENCFHCHGPDEKGRKGKLRLDTKEGAFRTKKPVLIPGRSDQSELISRITTKNPDDLMPPPDSHRQLTEAQIALLKRWVEEGARWAQHWAFIPPRRGEATSTGLSPSARLDAFINTRLRKESLSPAPEAPKDLWLRRVTLDLTGLPPTLAELDAFQSDTSTNAHEKVVDRLLASPRLGERLATDWLDLARFADTHGYQMDRYRPVWPYRDWVIRAFNQNLPFDQFVTWQLAGDLLPRPTKEQRLATAFNRLHNQNEEGGIVEEEFRVAYVVDRVNTFSTAFLGLTTECARCHDHKYDPVSQRDFYSLFAFFQNIDEAGQTSYFTDSTPVPTLLLSTDEQERELAELQERLRAQEQVLERLRQAAADDFSAWLRQQSGAASAPTIPGLVAHFSFDALVSNRVANLAGTNFAKAQENPQLVPGRQGQAVALSGENGFTFGKLGHFHRASPFTLSLWLQTSTRTPRQVILHHSKAPVDAGSRGYELLLENGRVAFGLHHMWPGNSLKVRTQTTLPTNQWVQVTVTYDGSSRAAGAKVFLDGRQAETEIVRDNLWKDISYGDEPELALGYRFRDSGFKGGRVDELKVFNRALTELEVREVAGGETLRSWLSSSDATIGAEVREPLFNYFLATAHPPFQQAATELQALRDQQRQMINPIPEIMAMQELPQPKPAFVLKRGAYDLPGERVSANTPAALPPFPAGQPTNRLGLARWLLQPDHPLMARVTVNRFWQMMFGTGLVETSDNFGMQGSAPSHPELLDWLAVDFVDHGWDVKRLLRLLALSQTYRQSSRSSPELLARDPANALLARGPARRLTAEMLRDSALAASGLLVEKLGGPSVKPYQPEGLWDIAMGKPRYDQGQGEDLHRRSLYTYWKRTVPPPAMMTFDAADRSYCTVRRQNTSTPLQALALLNDQQIVEASRALAARMEREGGDSETSRLAWLFRTLLNRLPSPRELAVLQHLFTEQREIFLTEKTAPSPETAARTVVAQALLNHDGSVMRR